MKGRNIRLCVCRRSVSSLEVYRLVAFLAGASGSRDLPTGRSFLLLLLLLVFIFSGSLLLFISCRMQTKLSRTSPSLLRRNQWSIQPLPIQIQRSRFPRLKCCRRAESKPGRKHQSPPKPTRLPNPRRCRRPPRPPR